MIRRLQPSPTDELLSHYHYWRRLRILVILLAVGFAGSIGLVFWEAQTDNQPVDVLTVILLSCTTGLMLVAQHQAGIAVRQSATALRQLYHQINSKDETP